MHSAIRTIATLGLITCLASAAPTPPPPNAILFSAMMRELSAKPGFTEALLNELEKNKKTGAALLTPALVDELRALILGKQWQRLDHFPGWTMREINPTIRVIGHIAGKEVPQPISFLDLGPYAADKSGNEDLDRPSTRPAFTKTGLVSDLGGGVIRGDGPNPGNAPLHSESQRLAEVMNRLAFNGLENTPPFTATIAGHTAHTPQELVDALTSTGHTVTVADARYFANFGHLHYKTVAGTQDVMAPFWVNTRLLVPGTQRPLLVPVSHTEYEWTIRGPRINAALAFYFGIDGKAEFRTTDQLNQAWVLGRHAHEYTGADAIEVTRLTGRLVVATVHLHAAHPTIPFGGYYAFGVCQDGVAAIEKKLTGQATLFPNTADTTLFTDPRDAEINDLIRAIPKDREGLPPTPDRIFGSLPTADMNAITIPGLASDLNAAQAAWHDGDLDQTRHWRRWIGILIAFTVLLLLLRRRRSSQHPPASL